jgi:rhamnose transport system permease protein
MSSEASRAETRGGAGGLARLLRWESALVVILAAVVIFGVAESSAFWSTTTIFFGGLDIGQVAIMALPMTMIVLTGEIDLSVASMLGLGCAVFGYAFEHHTGVVGAMVIALAVGAIGGALNGFLVAQVGLPSIAVTIGTLTMFRGIAEILLGQNEVSGFPLSLEQIGISPIFLHIAYPFFFFLVLAAIYGVVIHRTAFGRSLYAIGLNTEAAFFAGIRVKRTKFLLYVISGVICAATGIVYSLQAASSIYTAGSGLELNVVAVVLFGGVSIFGGRGSVIGVVLSVVIVGLTEVSFTLINISSQEQQVIFGGLLLLSVVVPNAGEIYRRLHGRVRRVRAPVSAGGGL